MYSRFLYGAAVLCAATALLLSGGLGCRTLEAPGDLALAAAANEHLALEPSSPEEQVGRPTSASAAPSLPEPVIPTALADDGWNVAVPSGESNQPPEYHWQHAGLDALLALPPAQQPDLAACLTSDDPVVVGNAAILLARAGEANIDRCLVETVRNANLRPAMRRAACEALSRLDTTIASPALSEFLDEYEDSHVSGYSPELHGELLRGLARHVDAATSPRFAAALSADDGEVRQAALYAFTISTVGVLPKGAVDLRSDPNPRVRSAALECLAARRHPQALEFAKAALLDFHLDVRLAAVRSLGSMGGDDSKAVLQRLLIHDPEAVRAGAVLALAAAGDDVTVFASARDPSWQVRRSVARALVSFPTPRAATIARQLLADRSNEVRRAVLTSLDGWPLELAGPILLSALGEGPYQTRKQAYDQLVVRWPQAVEYQLDAPSERRGEQLAQLQSAWTATQPAAPPASEHSPAPAALQPFTPEQSATPLAMHHEVLAKAPGVPVVAPSPLDQLTAEDVTVRRAAARQLADAISEQEQDEATLARLVDVGMAETDDQVWRDLLRAVKSSASASATRLVYVGTSHPAAEVRRVACGYLGAHPDPRHATVLVRALEDPNPAVVRAAVEALGSAGTLVEPAPLERLLTVDDKSLQVRAAQSLAVNGFTTGPAALIRLARDPDPAVRRQAVVAMGQLHDAAFVDTLVAELDDELSIRLASVASLAQIVGQDVNLTPGAEPPALADQVQGWKRWWEARQARPPAAPSPAG